MSPWTGVSSGLDVRYINRRSHASERFRRTLQGYFLPAILVGIAGLRIPAVTRHYLTSLPVILAATALGRVLNRRMDGRRFLVCVHVGLVVIGGMYRSRRVGSGLDILNVRCPGKSLSFRVGVRRMSRNTRDSEDEAASAVLSHFLA
jgi:hypothetical protein